MNPKSQNGFREFNPPAVIAARLSFLLVLLGWGAAVVLFVAGAVTQNMMHLGSGTALAATSFLIHGWLRRNQRWANVVDSFKSFGFGDTPSSDFSRQVQEWEALRIRRGTPGFDAWKFLQLQRDIESKAKNDPQLAAFWQDHHRD